MLEGLRECVRKEDERERERFVSYLVGMKDWQGKSDEQKWVMGNGYVW